MLTLCRGYTETEAGGRGPAAGAAPRSAVPGSLRQQPPGARAQLEAVRPRLGGPSTGSFGPATAPAVREPVGQEATVGQLGRHALAAASVNMPAAPQPVVIQQPCPVCKDAVMRAPWIAPCKHAACNLCWVTAIGKTMSCPICGAHTRKRNLTRVLSAAALQ
jgi:Zinc finger, C3HC4 type (RING finger)